LYVFDLARGGRARVTSGPVNDWFPVWSADGQRLYFSSTRLGASTVFQKPPSAAGEGEQVTPLRLSGVYASDVSPDGKHILMHLTTSTSGYDIATYEIASRTMTPFLASRFNEVQPRVSPNGRWLAYSSDESGRFQVYVRPFPRGEGQWPISAGGGMQPEWRRDGKELYFISGDGSMMAIDVDTAAPTFAAEAPRPLFPVDVPEAIAPYPNDYAVTADGQRFLVNAIVEQPVKPVLTVILNWMSR
jgi:Tol biopolymer transport system component